MKPITNPVPYSAYKDSGVEWLGEVPNHWEVRKLTRVARQETGHTPSRKVDAYWVPEECVIPWVSLADVWQLRSGEVIFIEETKEKVSEIGLANSAARLLPKDTVVLSRTASVGFPAILGAPMATTQDFAAWICGPALRPKFLYFVLLAMRPEFRRLMMGSTHQTIYMPDIRAFRVPLPPVDEQTAITRYLDYTDRRIQRYIRAKQKLIALLEEQRQAIIHQAVTGQIDVRTGQPYPVYQDSGVEWLGEVPEHWEIPRLGVLLQERGEINHDGRINEVLSVLRDRGVIPYSEKGNIGNKKSEDITRYKIVRPDDIVVNYMNVIIGSVGLSRYTGCLSPVYYVLTRRSKDDHPQYLNAYFQTRRFQKSLVRLGNGILAHRMRIPMELLKCEPFPRPPAEEQVAIVSFLDQATADLDMAVSSTQRQINLLSEYRTRLISDVVTGKLDIREAAAALPEVDPLETEADSEETLEPTTELAEEFEAIAAGASA